jgi:1-deoxy-D-xylulose 5-phosphate reductoisomerase
MPDWMADEIAVEAFLEGEIGFPGIAAVVEETLNDIRDARKRAQEETKPKK